MQIKIKNQPLVNNYNSIILFFDLKKAFYFPYSVAFHSDVSLLATITPLAFFCWEKRTRYINDHNYRTITGPLWAISFKYNFYKFNQGRNVLENYARRCGVQSDEEIQKILQIADENIEVSTERSFEPRKVN